MVSFLPKQWFAFHFLKTFFRLEKANALISNTDQTTPILVLFDCRSGKTVGNQLKCLDENEIMKTTDIMLSSLNDIDRSQKRVCKITLVSDKGEKYPLEVIIPKEEIPKTAPQSMNCFKKPENSKSKIKEIEKVTQQDIDTLPLILVGLNYQKYFPKSVSILPP